MKTDNVIKLGVDAALRSEQFLRKSSTWYREMGETVLVVNLQKSNFGAQYYLNLGVLVKGLPVKHGNNLPPKESDCHIRSRIETLKPEKEEHLRQVLDVENKSIDAAERQKRIEETIKSTALPFLLQCSTRAAVVAMRHTCPDCGYSGFCEEPRSPTSGARMRSVLLKNLTPGERTLLDRLPNLGSPKGKLVSELQSAETGDVFWTAHCDASVDSAGRLINNTEFLRAERNLLETRGWTYDQATRMWYPPVGP